MNLSRCSSITLRLTKWFCETHILKPSEGSLKKKEVWLVVKDSEDWVVHSQDELVCRQELADWALERGDWTF